MVVALDPQYFLDEIGLALDVAAPRGRLDRQIARSQRLDRAAEGAQDRGTFLSRHIETAEARRALGAQHIAAPPIGRDAGGDDFRRFAAAQFEHQPGRDFEPVADKGRVEPALEAIARVARDVEPAAGGGGAYRIEQSRLDEHFGRGVGAAGRVAADDPAEALHPAAVGDHRYLGVERVFADR